jgi:hypothetical protein
MAENLTTSRPVDELDGQEAARRKVRRNNRRQARRANQFRINLRGRSAGRENKQQRQIRPRFRRGD